MGQPLGTQFGIGNKIDEKSIIKLVYFNVRGRGELIRFILHAAEVNFEDQRMEFSEWAKVKDNTPSPTGMLPYIELDGKVYPESLSIARFLARRYGLEGKTNLEVLEADAVVAQMDDFRKNICNYAHAKEEEEKKNLIDVFIKDKGPKQFGRFEKMLEENGTGYLVGDGLTIADLSAYDLSEQLVKEAPDFFSAYPLFHELRQKIENLPGIAAYLEKREPTNF